MGLYFHTIPTSCAVLLTTHITKRSTCSLAYPQPLNKHRPQHCSCTRRPSTYKDNLPYSAAIKFQNIHVPYTPTCHTDPALLMHSTASEYKTDIISSMFSCNYIAAFHNITHFPCTSTCTTQPAVPTPLPQPSMHKT